MLLPYTEYFDQHSWTFSAFVVNVLCAVTFPNQCLQFNRFPTFNLQHGRYQQLREDWQDALVWLLARTNLTKQEQLLVAIQDPNPVLHDDFAKPQRVTVKHGKVPNSVTSINLQSAHI